MVGRRIRVHVHFSEVNRLMSGFTNLFGGGDDGEEEKKQVKKPRGPKNYSAEYASTADHAVC